MSQFYIKISSYKR